MSTQERETLELPVPLLICAMHDIVHNMSKEGCDETKVLAALGEIIIREMNSESSRMLAETIYECLPNTLVRCLLEENSIDGAYEKIRSEILMCQQEKFASGEAQLFEEASAIHVSPYAGRWIKEEMHVRENVLREMCWGNGRKWGSVFELQHHDMEQNLFNQRAWIGRSFENESVVYRVFCAVDGWSGMGRLVLLIRAQIVKRGVKCFAVVDEIHEWITSETQNIRNDFIYAIERNAWMDYIDFPIVAIPRGIRQLFAELAEDTGTRWTTVEDLHGEKTCFRCKYFEDPPTVHVTPIASPKKKRVRD